VTYLVRAPHIHVKFFGGTREILTMQFYIHGHLANKRDRIFNRLSESDAKAVSMVFSSGTEGEETTLDVVVLSAKRCKRAALS